MNEAMKIDHLSAGYGNKNILEDFSLVLEAGQFVSVIGPNGAGKTTLLRTITGLLKPSQGDISVFGKNIESIPARERAKLVGVVPQEIETPMSFTVEALAMIGRTTVLPRFGPPTREDRQAVERALVYTDVVDMRDRPFFSLSGGEKQRAVIAMVLAQEPRMILLDEATSNLDINHRIEVMQIVERLNREKHVTVVMISHDLNLAAEFSHRLLLLDHGQLVSDGKPSEVLKEEILGRVYHCDVHVQQNPSSGAITVVPARRLDAGPSGSGRTVHIIAGGGCGEDLMRRLSLCDYRVTCGVLNRQDSDTQVADALGIETVLEKPFSPISEKALERARDMAKSADAVVVCAVPFGPGNLINLKLAEEALAENKRVFIRDGIADRDYTSGKLAEQKAQDLLQKGARNWSNITDLLRQLGE